MLREAFRVLKPGGRFAVSDVVVRGDVPADIRRSMELWVGCIAGALEEREYAAKLQAAASRTSTSSRGASTTSTMRARSSRKAAWTWMRLAPHVDGRFASAFVRARKPAVKSCCGPECCVA